MYIYLHIYIYVYDIYMYIYVNTYIFNYIYTHYLLPWYIHYVQLQKRNDDPSNLTDQFAKDSHHAQHFWVINKGPDDLG